MRRYWPAVVAASLTVSSLAVAQDPTQQGAPKVASAEVAVGTAVADRMLSGAAETFAAATTEKLYCFSKVTDAENTEIEHVWYKGEAEVARVKLRVGGSPWRTHSSKNIGPDGAGDWRCEVVGSDGKVIQSARFKVE
jgi:hypothetical protein